MKLIPKAKPVKIRIKSGGVECNDLNTLRKSFCVEDLQKIEPKQLIKWLNQVDGGSEIANKLSTVYSAGSDANDLEYYNLFFNLHESNLNGVWKELKDVGWKESANVLVQKLLKKGDSIFLGNILQNSSDEKKWEIISHLSDSVLQKNGNMLFNVGKQTFEESNDTKSFGSKILECLSDAGVEEAKSYLHHLKGINIKPEYLMNAISAILDGLETLNSIVEDKLGCKTIMLPDNILSYLNAVYRIFGPSNTLFKSDYTNLIKQLTNNPYPKFDEEFMEGLSTERLFLCALIEGRCKKEEERDIIVNYLRRFRDEYFFARLYGLSDAYIKSAYSGILPNEMLETYKGYNFSQIWFPNTPFSVFKHFMRIYFRHFLEPKYFNGDLSTI